MHGKGAKTIKNKNKREQKCRSCRTLARQLFRDGVQHGVVDVHKLPQHLVEQEVA